MGYTNYLVTFIDVLGFRDLIDSTSKGTDTPENVLEVLRTFRKKFDESVPTSQRGIIRGFSDLFLHCREIPSAEPASDSPIPVLNEELNYVARRQLELAFHDVLIRGAICEGELLAESGPREDDDGRIVFGPGIVKAYELESAWAVYPRVIIDNKLVWKSKQRDSIQLREEFYTQGEDGAYFLDYLRGALTSMAWLGINPWHSALRHMRFVERRVAEAASQKSKIKQKIMWLALYHNRTMKKFQDQPPKIGGTPVTENFAGCVINPSSLNW